MKIGKAAGVWFSGAFFPPLAEELSLSEMFHRAMLSSKMKLLLLQFRGLARRYIIQKKARYFLVDEEGEYFRIEIRLAPVRQPTHPTVACLG